MKKAISILLTLAMLISCCSIFASAEKGTEKANNYPFILVHGLGGWGQYDAATETYPYWGSGAGMSEGSGDFVEFLRENGYEAYAVSVGPVNSAWDRACEIYAQLTGTVVDYGEAHSKAHNHARFGRSFEGQPLMGRVWSPDEPINLIGHSFGGPASRLFTSLMAFGDEDEIAATGKDTSPLFTGGHNSIHSCITLSAPHNGTQVSNILYDIEWPFYILVMLYNLIGATIGNDFMVFSLQMGHFGLTPKQGEKRTTFNLNKVQNYFSSGDNCYHDMTLRGAAELNESIKLVPETYYYSYSTAATKTGFDGKQIIYSTVTPIFYISSAMLRISEGKTYDGVKIEGDWAVNDGIVPLKSARYPLCDEATALSYEQSISSGETIESGRWYYMKTLDGTDHFDFCGTRDYPTSFEDFYFSMIETANAR